MIQGITRTLFAAAAFAFVFGAQAAEQKGGKLSGGDRGFVDKALMSGNTEVEAGNVALQKGNSESVKKFGQMLVDDHTKAGEELKGIISNIGYTPDKTGPDQKAVKALSGRSADRFDREFADKMVGMHEKDVKLFKRQAEKGDNPELKQFAAKTLPTLEEHLKMARELRAELKQNRKK